MTHLHRVTVCSRHSYLYLYLYLYLYYSVAAQIAALVIKEMTDTTKRHVSCMAHGFCTASGWQMQNLPAHGKFGSNDASSA